MRYFKLYALTLVLLFSSPAVAEIINGDFSAGLTGWISSAVDGANNPIGPSPFINALPGGGVNIGTGQTVDDVTFSTLEQTFVVDALQPVLFFDFSSPTQTADPTSTGASSFLDSFFLSLDNGIDFFELLLLLDPQVFEGTLEQY